MPQRGKYEANDSPSVQYGERVLSWLYTPTGAPGMILWTHHAQGLGAPFILTWSFVPHRGGGCTARYCAVFRRSGGGAELLPTLDP
ncbi:unnamed protein product [Gadus morhua 'NCC']